MLVKKVWFLFGLATVRACEPQLDKVRVKIFEKNDQSSDSLISGCLTPENTAFLEATRIKIVNQTVKSLPEGFAKNLDKLQDLILYDDEIEQVQAGAFENLKQLALLNLGKNKLRKLAGGIFTSLPIYRLILSDNRIEHIETNTFDRMSNLETILLDVNKITEFDPDWFFNTPQLKSIYINSNQISEIPANAFKNFSPQEKLLRQIDLSRNRIKTIHKMAFDGLEFIGELLLYNNELENLEFGTGIKFDTLMLENNKISCFTADFYEKVAIFRRLYVKKNPIDVGCLEKLEDWAKSQNITLEMSATTM